MKFPITGQDITMESQLPIGDVAYGMAWAFYVNFLQHTLHRKYITPSPASLLQDKMLLLMSPSLL